MDQLSLGAPTMALGKAGLAAGTTTTITIGNQVDYAIRSKVYRMAAVNNTPSPTLDAQTGKAFVALAASQACAFAICLDSGGNLQVYQSPIVNLDANGNYQVAPQPAGFKETHCMLGYLIAKNGSTGSAWTFGASNWTATGMTATFVDALAMTDRPQTS